MIYPNQTKRSSFDAGIHILIKYIFKLSETLEGIEIKKELKSNATLRIPMREMPESVRSFTINNSE